MHLAGEFFLGECFIEGSYWHESSGENPMNTFAWWVKVGDCWGECSLISADILEVFLKG
jgi:hypothetical protein